MTFRCLLPLATVTPKWIRRASLRNQHSDDDDGDDRDGDGDGDDRYDDRDGDGDGDDRDDDCDAYMDPACIIAQSR